MRRCLPFCPGIPGQWPLLRQTRKIYAQTFKSDGKAIGGTQYVLSCNCILNFLCGELEGKDLGAFYGPITLGEIAYQLLTQTLVYLQIVENKY
jgi:hypothetical protein